MKKYIFLLLMFGNSISKSFSQSTDNYMRLDTFFQTRLFCKGLAQDYYIVSTSADGAILLPRKNATNKKVVFYEVNKNGFDTLSINMKGHSVKYPKFITTSNDYLVFLGFKEAYIFEKDNKKIYKYYDHLNFKDDYSNCEIGKKNIYLSESYNFYKKNNMIIRICT